MNTENKDTKKGVRLKTDSTAGFKMPQSKMTQLGPEIYQAQKTELARNRDKRNFTHQTVENGNGSRRERSNKWELSVGALRVVMLRRHERKKH